MKSLFLLVLLTSGLSSLAQWTYDPENPQVVSNGDCVQSRVRQLADGSGGTFLFWLDARSDCNNQNFDVYGQHYDGAGNELWEPGGRELANYAANILRMEVLRAADGNLLIGMHSAVSSFTDSLRFRKVDTEGTALWSQDLIAAVSDGCQGTYILGFESFSFMEESAGYVVLFTPVYCGGSNGNRITRFDDSGNLTGPFQGEPEGNQWYIG